MKSADRISLMSFAYMQVIAETLIVSIQLEGLLDCVKRQMFRGVLIGVHVYYLLCIPYLQIKTPQTI